MLMDEELEILVNGMKKGTLHVAQNGLMTEFDAVCEPVDRVLRLSVYGEDGTEGKLGVMVPEDGVLKLHRSVSRNAMAGFPQRAVIAGESGVPPTEAESQKSTEYEERKADEESDSAAVENGEAADPCTAETQEMEEPVEKESDVREDPDITWFPVPAGSLVSVRTPALLAMPWQEGITYGEDRLIEGRRYAVIRPDEIAIPAEE